MSNFESVLRNKIPGIPKTLFNRNYAQDKPGAGWVEIKRWWG